MEPGEIGIVDYRNILRLLQEMHQCDLGDFSLISLKRRIEGSMKLHSMRYADNLLTKLREDPSFFDVFMHDISVESTEMFRDPSLWRIMRDEILTRQIRPGNRFKIWLPSNVSGDELFTLCIILKEAGLSDNVEITATYQSEASLRQIHSGILKINKLEVSEENYKRYQGRFTLADYYTKQGEQTIKSPELIKNVKFVKQNLTYENAPKGMDLIIFRNQMIYFNQSLEERMYGLFWDSLNTGGLLVIGIKENPPQNTTRVFKTFQESERIYQKK